MKPIICALLLLVSAVIRSRVSLQLEIVALRHQLAVYQRTTKRPPISSGDRYSLVVVLVLLVGVAGCSVFCPDRDGDCLAA
jgi:hypothetical protein